MPLPVIGHLTEDEAIALGAPMSSGQDNWKLDLNLQIHGIHLANGATQCDTVPHRALPVQPSVWPVLCAAAWDSRCY
jgi:hypothetical protein